MATPEGRIKGYLDKMLKAHGVWYFSPNAGPFGRAGIPDRIAIVAGQFVGIECKASPKQKPTDLQAATMRQIAKAGGKVFLVSSREDVTTVEKYIVERLPPC